MPPLVVNLQPGPIRHGWILMQVNVDISGYIFASKHKLEAITDHSCDG